MIAPQPNPPDPELVEIPAGRFLMGSPPDELGRDEDEVQHQVELTRSVWMGATPVTQQQWREVMGFNPSELEGDLLPVESVSWFDAVAFCNTLSIRHGLAPFYDLERVVGEPGGHGFRFDARPQWGGPGYRLPTEAEWERAARLAAQGEIPALGNMLGNTWQWCGDWYGPYPPVPITDPLGPETGTRRVNRGGAHDVEVRFSRPSFRHWLGPVARNRNLGFRVCRSG